MVARTLKVTTLAAALLLLAACARTPALKYLEEEIPPCQPAPGSRLDPCDPDPMRFSFSFGEPVGLADTDVPTSLREMLDNDMTPAWVTHVVLRGNYLPGTVRCTAGDPFRPPTYLYGEFGYETESPLDWSIKCYVDVRVNAYLVGSGPPTFTALVLRLSEGGDIDSEYTQEFIEEVKGTYELSVSAVFPGREHVMFIGPPVDLSSEAWRILGFWDVQRRQDGTVIVEHPETRLLEMDLPSFAEELTIALQERGVKYEGRIGDDDSLPMLVTDVNKLRDFYAEVGAHASGAPTPVQPPPPYPKAEIGKEYPYNLFTNCPLFDGRFWLADPPFDGGGSYPLPDWMDPTASGVMVLEREDRAVFTADSGQVASFVPLPPEVDFEGDTCVWP